MQATWEEIPKSTVKERKRDRDENVANYEFIREQGTTMANQGSVLLGTSGRLRRVELQDIFPRGKEAGYIKCCPLV